MLWLSGARIARTVNPVFVEMALFVTAFGMRTIGSVLMVNARNINNNKNVTIIAAVLTLGVSGAVCNFGVVSIGTTALAMIVGIVLNLILKENNGKLRRRCGVIFNDDYIEELKAKNPNELTEFEKDLIKE